MVPAHVCELVVGGEGWTFREGRRSRTHNGDCDLESHTIDVYAGLTERERAETIVHELLHACFPTMREERVAEAAEDITVALSRVGVQFKRGWKRGENRASA